jgi:hypothetical protein
MTTRLHLADGDHFDVDEETEATGLTHFNGVAVDRAEYIGPTPPKPVKPQDVAARRAELLAELDALGVSQPDGAAETPVPAGELADLRAQVAALTARIGQAS